VWDRAEQIDPLRGLIHNVLQTQPAAADAHPLSALPEQVDAEDVARQLDAIGAELAAAADGKAALSLLAAARLRERVAQLADRAAWVGDEKARRHLVERTGKLLERLERP